MRILLLGGSSEASGLARTLAGRADVEALISLAGVTRAPAPAPIPRRIGGFGGAEGLAAFLRSGRYDAIVDATHPFAARMSDNAARAATLVGIRHAIFSRPQWRPEPGDDWREVPDSEAAVAALGARPKRVLLAVGGARLGAFAAGPPHFYFVRSIDRPANADMPRSAEWIEGRPPFALADEIALLRGRGIETLVCKNSGGEATRAKLDAAREIGVPVVMLRRPPPPAGVRVFHAQRDVLEFLGLHGRPP